MILTPELIKTVAETVTTLGYPAVINFILIFVIFKMIKFQSETLRELRLALDNNTKAINSLQLRGKQNDL